MASKNHYISQFLISGNDIVNASVTFADLGTVYTDNVTEGASLYYSNARVANAFVGTGTANALLYLDAGKVATTGSALTFDGTRIRAGGTIVSNSYYVQTNGGVQANTSMVAQGTLQSYSGAGVFMSYESTYGRIESYDYTGATYKNLAIAPNGGNVGIGTASPAYKLDVLGTGATLARFVATSGQNALCRIIGSNYSTESVARLFLGEDDTYGMTVEYDGVNNIGYLGMNNNVDPTGSWSKRIQMSRAGTEVAFMAGNVGIGTVSPTTKLEVVGNGKITHGVDSPALTVSGIQVPLNVVGASTGYTQGAISLSSSTTDNPGGRGQGVFLFNEGNDTTWYMGTAYGSADTFYISRKASTASLDPSAAWINASGGTALLTLTNGGALTVTSLTESSSITLKENVNPIQNALDSIIKLVGVTYDRKDGSAKNKAGLIKEDVEKVLPNLVNDHGIHYTNIIAYLVESIKELKAEIDTLKGNHG